VHHSGEPVVQERPRFVIRKEDQPMAEMGYVLSSEEMSPNEMVRNALRAEEAGFTTAWISDHYHP
jgi:alkanesulfonate monooxygenase SsuD/methylene tetrahydromethanopterin reductase-like flavin-dependent oxidoreductase (luciferase family)